MANIAKNIRTLRTAQKMTQDQLAECLHVTRQTVSNYETGKSQPDIDTIVRLAEALQADPNTLIYGIPTPPARKQEYVKTAIAVAGVLLLAYLTTFQRGAMEKWARYQGLDFIRVAWYTMLVPFFYWLCGYGAMSLLSCFMGLKPKVQPAMKIVAIVTVTVIESFAALFVVEALRLNVIAARALAERVEFNGADYWSFSDIPVFSEIYNEMVGITTRIPWVFLLFGAAFWLFRLKKVPKNSNAQ